MISISFLFELVVSRTHFIHSICPVLNALDAVQFDLIFSFLIVCIHKVGHLFMLHRLHFKNRIFLFLLLFDLDIQILSLEINLFLACFRIVKPDFVVEKLIEFGDLSPRAVIVLWFFSA